MFRTLCRLCTLSLVAVPGSLPAQAPPAVPYTPASGGTELLSRGGLLIRVLVDAAVLGGTEIEVAELTLPPSGPAAPRPHRHGAVELLYVLSGRLDHVVNGQAHRLEPGMVGIVRPGDSVAHHVVSAEPVRALVIWAPAGELARLRPAFTTGPAPARRPAIEGLERLRAAWTRAYEAGDAAALADLYTADAVRMPYDAPSQHGREAIVSAYGASFAGRAFDPAITLTPDAPPEVRGDLAIERGTYREILRARQGPQVLVEEGKYVSAARREPDGRWRYAWSIFNRDAPARPLTER